MEPDPDPGSDDRVELIYSSYNRLIFNTHSSQPGYFLLSYLYSGHWHALMNGKKTVLYRANGVAHALPVSTGKNRIEFFYWSPAAFWGILLSGLIMWLSGTVISFQFIKNPLKYLLSGALLCVAAGGFFLWYQSLYTGGNLGYVYAWEDEPVPNRPNLAYGKRTTMSSVLSSDHIHLFRSSKAVNGYKRSGNGFSTGVQ